LAFAESTLWSKSKSDLLKGERLVVELWSDLLTRFAVDSILPAAGLITATAGILFAIYYWTRLGRDQLLGRCALAALMLHLAGFLFLFRLPASTLAHREDQEVKVSIEWRSADEVRGEQAWADDQSTRSDLEEPTLDPVPPEVTADALTRPTREPAPEPATISPSLEEPAELAARSESVLPEASPAPDLAPPTVLQKNLLPAEPTIEEADRSLEVTSRDRTAAEIAAASPPDPTPSAMRLLEESSAPPERLLPAPAVDEPSPTRVDRPLLPESETLVPPPEPVPPGRPIPAVAENTPIPSDGPTEQSASVPIPSRYTQEAPAPPPEPASKPAPVPNRFRLEQAPEIPDDEAEASIPKRADPSSALAKVDVSALIKRTDSAPQDVIGPRTFWENRIAPNRLEIVFRHGGSQETEKAVAAALEWLAAHQSEDGRWDSDGFDLRCPAGDLCEGHAVERQSDTGLTGLSLLAFLGAGHTHLSTGKYRETVRRGLSWLLRTQRPDGDLQFGGRIYAHAMATISITEAFAMTKDERLKGPAQKAILWLAQAQHPESGGWRYGPGQFGDTSVYGWAVLALRSARSAGLDVPDTTWLAARRWLPLVVSGRNKGLASYRPGYPPSHAMTAEALFCRQVLEGKVDANLAAEAADHILTKLPDPADYHLYYWYYGTLCLFQMGGPTWDRWNDRLTATLLGSQRTSGHAQGSWDPGKPFGVDGGRVFSTACSCLCLEVYYRYLPLYQAGPGGNASPPASEPR
jgi:hypothetical protein